MPLSDLDSLRCFQAAALHLNFRQAARTVGLSPTAFSDRMKRLEEELGVRLFERTTRKVTLTTAGIRLVESTKDVLAAVRLCEKSVRTDGSIPFSLTVGTRYELGLSFLVAHLEGLKQAQPDRSIHLQFGDSPDLLSRLRRGDIDAVLSSVRIDDKSLQYHTLHEEKYVLCAKPGVVTSNRPLRTPDDAKSHTLLDTDSGMPLFRYVTDATRELWRFAGVEYLGTIAAIKYRLLEGAGVAVMPEYFVAPELKAGRLESLVPLTETEIPTDHFRLIWKNGHPFTAEIQLLATELSAFPLK